METQPSMRSKISSFPLHSSPHRYLQHSYTFPYIFLHFAIFPAIYSESTNGFINFKDKLNDL